MRKALEIDSQGRLIVQCESLQDELPADQSLEEKQGHMKHLRSLQSTNLVTRSAIKIVGLLRPEGIKVA